MTSLKLGERRLWTDPYMEREKNNDQKLKPSCRVQIWLEPCDDPQLWYFEAHLTTQEVIMLRKFRDHINCLYRDWEGSIENLQILSAALFIPNRQKCLGIFTPRPLNLVEEINMRKSNLSKWSFTFHKSSIFWTSLLLVRLSVEVSQSLQPSDRDIQETRVCIWKK